MKTLWPRVVAFAIVIVDVRLLEAAARRHERLKFPASRCRGREAAEEDKKEFFSRGGCGVYLFSGAHSTFLGEEVVT